jgi:hypothetical protein
MTHRLKRKYIIWTELDVDGFFIYLPASKIIGYRRVDMRQFTHLYPLESCAVSLQCANNVLFATATARKLAITPHFHSRASVASNIRPGRLQKSRILVKPFPSADARTRTVAIFVPLSRITAEQLSASGASKHGRRSGLLLPRKLLRTHSARKRADGVICRRRHTEFNYHFPRISWARRLTGKTMPLKVVIAAEDSGALIAAMSTEPLVEHGD